MRVTHAQEREALAAFLRDAVAQYNDAAAKGEDTAPFRAYILRCTAKLEALTRPQPTMAEAVSTEAAAFAKALNSQATELLAAIKDEARAIGCAVGVHRGPWAVAQAEGGTMQQVCACGKPYTVKEVRP